MHRRAKFVESNFEALATRSKNAISALSELMKDSALVRHRKTLDEVTKLLSKTIENDQKWLTKCQKLDAELAANEIKVKTALRLSEEDKTIMDTLKEELNNAWDLIEELKTHGDINPNILCSNCKAAIATEYNSESELYENSKLIENFKVEKHKLLGEIEKVKLQVFELEEELTNKEKSIEELTSCLNLKTKAFESMSKYNEELKMLLNENEKSNIVIKNDNGTQSDSISKFETVQVQNKMDISLKEQLQDIHVKEKLSAEKLKLLLKKNNILYSQLQKARNNTNLSKIQLKSQEKMLCVLLNQCCKFEDKDKKQVRIIHELENIRNNHMSKIGKLEQELHELKKEIKYNITYGKLVAT